MESGAAVAKLAGVRTRGAREPGAPLARPRSPRREGAVASDVGPGSTSHRARTAGGTLEKSRCEHIASESSLDASPRDGCVSLKRRKPLELIARPARVLLRQREPVVRGPLHPARHLARRVDRVPIHLAVGAKVVKEDRVA